MFGPPKPPGHTVRREVREPQRASRPVKASLHEHINLQARDRPAKKPPLRTPPLPPDMMQWGSDGRFRKLDCADGADLQGEPLPQTDFRAPMRTLFSTAQEADVQRRKAVIKAALQEITRASTRLPSTTAIRITANAAETFLTAHRDEHLRFPLSDANRAELHQLIAAQFSSQLAVIAPPGLPASRSSAAAEAISLAAFREVRESHRIRLHKFFALYDPGRIGEVDELLQAAGNLGFAGAEEDLIRSLVLRYGPEPSPTGSEAPAVVISDPVTSTDGTVHIFASVRGERTDTPSWSLSSGNPLSSTPMGLDTLAALGVAQAHVISATDLGEFDRALTLCLDLKPGAVRPSTQYTVRLAMIGRGGSKALDSKTFFVESEA
jgi:hypothetical protein